MEQEIGGGGGDMNQQPQNQPPPPPQPPQQCPRCDSMNTKFCYYNNYSLSQPRYFCKTCKRYWTQGGTLRNIPIGGSSRKGKRSKYASSSQPQLPPQPQTRSQRVTHEVLQLPNQPNLTTFMRPTPPTVVQPTNPYYQGGGGIGGGGGYFSSMAAVHSMNPPPQPLDQALNGVGSSNSGLLSGFNTAVSGSLGSQPYHPGQIHPQQFYPEHGFNYPSNMANHRAPDTSLWNVASTSSSTSGNTQNNTRGAGSSSVIPNHWPNLPGNGSHYQ
ncbi:hypothetical protein Lal_00026195 [Lupinus albus]|uniref:Dof zinc finger protein n=1 Tax=Lupinus albus TaxID=3870 RepID=A0A6A4Q135_LUPAL|nr:putative transcription factor C2C2-Dof family [Lupinus albus]KAF1861759.1 hypothetical protein Lal_00026195 [Lupinus albus]